MFFDEHLKFVHNKPRKPRFAHADTPACVLATPPACIYNTIYSACAPQAAMCCRVWYYLLLVSLCAQARAQGQCSDPSFYMNASGACVACPGANQIDGGRPTTCDCIENYYRTEAYLDCNACPAGTSAPQGQNIQITKCTCAPGHSPAFDISARTLVCTICPVHTYLGYNGMGWTSYSATKPCTACPQNSFSTQLGATSKEVCAGPGYCKADTYWRAQSGACSACPAHSSNPETPGTAQAATVCLCDAGFRSEVDGSGVQTCVACAPGTFAAAAGANACTACANGTSAAAAGATACEPCAAGWHTQAPGASACLRVFTPAANGIAAKAGTTATVKTEKTGNTGDVSAGMIVGIVLGVGACLGLCVWQVRWMRGRPLARVREAGVPFAAVLPGPGQPYLLVRA